MNNSEVIERKQLTTNEIYSASRHLCLDQNNHINLMWDALNEGSDNRYSQVENGVGIIHIYEFDEGDAPNFQTVSNDIFNQIEIRVKVAAKQRRQRIDLSSLTCIRG